MALRRVCVEFQVQARVGAVISGALDPLFLFDQLVDVAVVPVLRVDKVL